MSFVYVEGNSYLHKLHPLTKLFGLLIVVVLIFLTNSLFIILFFLIYLFIIIFLAKINVRNIYSRFKFILVFAGTIILAQLLFHHEGKILCYIIPKTFPFGPNFPITEVALHDGFLIALRFLIIITGSAIFTTTTHPNEFVHSLNQIGIPYRYAFTIGLALRYIPIFDLEANHVRDARLSRGIDLEKRGIRGLKSSIRYTILPLTVSAISRVETLTLSMEGRAFGLFSKRTFLRKSRISIKDLYLSIIFCFILGTTIYFF